MQILCHIFECNPVDFPLITENIEPIGQCCRKFATFVIYEEMYHIVVFLLLLQNPCQTGAGRSGCPRGFFIYPQGLRQE